MLPKLAFEQMKIRTASLGEQSSIPDLLGDIHPPPRARSRTLAALFAGADCSSLPVMAPPWPGPPQLAPEHVTKFAALPGARSALPFPL